MKTILKFFPFLTLFAVVAGAAFSPLNPYPTDMVVTGVYMSPDASQIVALFPGGKAGEYGMAFFNAATSEFQSVSHLYAAQVKTALNTFQAEGWKWMTGAELPAVLLDGLRTVMTTFRKKVRGEA